MSFARRHNIMQNERFAGEEANRITAMQVTYERTMLSDWQPRHSVGEQRYWVTSSGVCFHAEHWREPVSWGNLRLTMFKFPNKKSTAVSWTSLQFTSTYDVINLHQLDYATLECDKIYSCEATIRNTISGWITIYDRYTDSMPAACVVCRVSCVVWRAPCAVRRVTCAVCRVSCAVRRAPCAVRRAPCAVRRAPSAERRAPCARAGQPPMLGAGDVDDAACDVLWLRR